MTADRTARHNGFTLVEVIIVVAILGLVMSALAAAFVVVLRVSPASQTRADDARALLGLTNWVSQDVASAEEDQFIIGPHTSSCSSGVPASTGLLELRWSEGVTIFSVDYRYVPAGSGSGTIHRYSCKDGGAAAGLRVSPTLRDIPSATFAPPAPVNITLVPTTLVDGVTPGSKGLQFQVFVLDEKGAQRELLSLDATTSNRHGELPPIGESGGTNQPPVAVDGVLDPAIAGVASNVALVGSDPEGATPLAFSVVTSTIPSGWTITVADDVATVTPAASAFGTHTFDFAVTDPVAPFAADIGTVTVNVIPPATNQPPNASAVVVTGRADVQMTVPLPVTDPEGESPLTITSVTGVPNNWAGPTISGSNVTFTPHVNASGQFTFNYTAQDAQGATATSTLTINICEAAIQSVDPASVVVNNTGSLQAIVRVTITSNGFCDPLVLTFLSQTTQTVEHVEQFNGGTFVEIGPTEYVWTVPTTPNGNPRRSVELNLRQGANGPLESTATLETRR